MPIPSREIAMSDLLEACAVELDGMAKDCARLQDDLSPVLLSGAVASLDAQVLDVLTQSLGAISQYLQSLSRQAPAHWRTDPSAAAAGLPLAGLAARLTNQEVGGSLDGDALELFD
jgi:hypothetical protein